MSNLSSKIAANWQSTLNEVAESAIAAGRDPEEIRIVGVSKYVDAETTRALHDAGCLLLGESRPQSLWDKAAALSDLDCSWHFIGHLQRNKVKRTIPIVDLVHSVDSIRLAKSISETVQELQLGERNCLLEVNISGDNAKHGIAPGQALETLNAIAQLPGIRVKGLMAMASYGSDGPSARSDFARLRELRDQLDSGGLPSEVSLRELSMGMSGDFREAITEGSTIVRIGSRLFE